MLSYFICHMMIYKVANAVAQKNISLIADEVASKINSEINSPVAKLTAFSVALSSGRFNMKKLEELHDEFYKKNMLAHNLLCDIVVVEQRNISEGDIALFNVFFGDLLASERACNAERVAFGEYIDGIGIFPNFVIGRNSEGGRFLNEDVYCVNVVPFQNVGTVERVFFAVQPYGGGDDAVCTRYVFEYGIVAVFDCGGVHQFGLAVYNPGQCELDFAGLLGGFGNHDMV